MGFNPYVVTRPLRQVLYKRETVETMPEWIDGEARITTTSVPPSRAARDLFEKPLDELVTHFFGDAPPPDDVSASDWAKHRWACRAAVAGPWCEFHKLQLVDVL
jgi:hypothetical protein